MKRVHIQTEHQKLFYGRKLIGFDRTLGHSLAQGPKVTHKLREKNFLKSQPILG